MTTRVWAVRLRLSGSSKHEIRSETELTEGGRLYGPCRLTCIKTSSRRARFIIQPVDAHRCADAAAGPRSPLAITLAVALRTAYLPYRSEPDNCDRGFWGLTSLI